LVGLPDGSFLYCFSNDLSLTPELVAHGIYDRRYWTFLGHLLNPGDRVVEVGANIGLFTVRMARLVGRFGRVDAFEADSTVSSLLKVNLQTNWLTDRVTVHDVAAGATNGTSRFTVEPALRGNGRLSDDGTVEVNVRRLDSTLRSDLPIHLLKIDVEGAEAAVLEGAAGLLASGAVRVIDIEVIRSNSGPSWARLCGLMRQLADVSGATIATLNADGSERLTTVDSVIARAGHFPHVIFRLP
jgi:FkbM family methyltransferase